MDIEKMSIEQINAYVKNKRTTSIMEVRNEIEKTCQRYGYTLGQVFTAPFNKPGRPKKK